MFALLYSDNSGKTWMIQQVDDDKSVLVALAENHKLTDVEKLLQSLFGDAVKYKIVKVEPAED